MTEKRCGPVKSSWYKIQSTQSIIAFPWWIDSSLEHTLTARVNTSAHSYRKRLKRERDRETEKQTVMNDAADGQAVGGATGVKSGASTSSLSLHVCADKRGERKKEGGKGGLETFRGYTPPTPFSLELCGSGQGSSSSSFSLFTISSFPSPPGFYPPLFHIPSSFSFFFILPLCGAAQHKGGIVFGSYNISFVDSQQHQTLSHLWYTLLYL